MLKKNKSNKWKPIKLEGPIVANDLEGLVGIEELKDYNIDSVLNNNKNKKKRNCSEAQLDLEEKKDKDSQGKGKSKKFKSNEIKSKIKISSKENEVIKYKPGAFVRNPNLIALSKSENIIKTVVKKKSNKKQKIEIGQVSQTEENKDKCTVDELNAWNIVALPDPLLQGLANLGFTKPTAIQELTLPAAIFGRRDILGAAETGSGKTLAFGLPILTGILKQKENKAQKNNSSITEDNEESNVIENDNAEFLNSEESGMIEIESKADEDSDESDFEEREEVLEEINENGIGCVRSIDNIQFQGETGHKSLKPLYALILTPTRELAVQIKNHLIAVAKFTDIKVAVVLGGMAAVKQERILSKGPEIVVATPGRLWELIQEGNPHLSQIDNIKYLAIDETDRMIEKYHFQELHQLLERLNMDKEKCKERQTFVFSATLTMVHDLPRYLQKKKKIRNSKKIHKLTSEEKLEDIIEKLGITNPKIVDVTQERSGTAKTLTECRINCGLEEKDYYVYYFLQRHPGRTLIFCNAIGCVKRLAHLLSILECPALPLHAAMQQRQRLKNLERFRDNPHGILVATDVAARGLDIPNVEHVLHYQTPRTSESYVHRSGRTARACKEGITVLLIEPNELKNYVKMCSTLGRTQDLPHFPVIENMLSAVKYRVNLARKLDKLELKTKKTNSETGWLQKAAKEMDIILDDNDFTLEEDKEEKAVSKRQINAMRQELKSLLPKPIFPKGFSAKYPTSTSQLNETLVQGDQSTQKAVDIMKTHLENSKNKKNRIKLFKRKLGNKEEKSKLDIKNLNKIVKNKNKKVFKK